MSYPFLSTLFRVPPPVVDNPPVDDCSEDATRRPQPATETLAEFEISNNELSQVPSVARSLVQMATELGICDEPEASRVQVALEEALTNAIVHGNLEVPSSLKETDEWEFYEAIAKRRGGHPYSRRIVRVEAIFKNCAARFRIEDDGPGFDAGRLEDPTRPENVGRIHGRGVALMRSFMDRVQFSPRGNVVTMYKRREPKTRGKAG